jgi:uncharacterized integral membrane protein
MKTAKMVALTIIGVALVVLVLQNNAPVHARFLWLSAEVPVIVLLFLSALGGFVSGMIATLLLQRTPTSKPDGERSKSA